MPGMRSCSGVNVPCPGVRGAEGPGTRQGVTARWRVKDAWSAGAGRGTRTGEEGWDARDEWARHHQVLHPQTGCTGSIRRLCTDGVTADRGSSGGCPGTGLRVERSCLTALQQSAEGQGGGRHRHQRGSAWTNEEPALHLERVGDGHSWPTRPRVGVLPPLKARTVLREERKSAESLPAAEWREGIRPDERATGAPGEDAPVGVYTPP